MTTKKTALGFILAAFIILFFTAAANSQETYDPQRLMFMATEIQSDEAVEACSEHRYEKPTESTLNLIVTVGRLWSFGFITDVLAIEAVSKVHPPAGIFANCLLKQLRKIMRPSS